MLGLQLYEDLSMIFYVSISKIYRQRNAWAEWATASQSVSQRGSNQLESWRESTDNTVELTTPCGGGGGGVLCKQWKTFVISAPIQRSLLPSCDTLGTLLVHRLPTRFIHLLQPQPPTNKSPTYPHRPTVNSLSFDVRVVRSFASRQWSCLV